jgi:hypothetical protein
MLEVRWNPRPAGLAFPTQEKLEALAMPADKRFWALLPPMRFANRTSGQATPASSGRIVGPSGLDSAFLVEGELFAQEEILGRERTFRS